MPSKPKAKPTAPRNQSTPSNSSLHGLRTEASNSRSRFEALREHEERHGTDETEGRASIPQQSGITVPEPHQEGLETSTAQPTVNRKKQKRRMKEAAKKAAGEYSSSIEQPVKPSAPHTNGYAHGNNSQSRTQHGSAKTHETLYTNQMMDPDAGHIPDVVNYGYNNHNYILQEPSGSSKKRSKRPGAEDTSLHREDDGIRPPPSLPPMVSQSRLDVVDHTSRTSNKEDRIWNTSTAEERERIKEFWLGLGESDRRSLVRIEKEAVLKKMKEQQKHSCSCTVCGRKRTAIEEELEVLYDAYYEELETYANHQHFGLDASRLPAPRVYGRGTSNMPSAEPANPVSPSYAHDGSMEEMDDIDELYSDKDEVDSFRDSGGIFSFGNSLTAQGGILTVADDLLKNDGKKFIEMMEQLAERRMQREEESRMVASGLGNPTARHMPEEEDESYDEEDDDGDYNSEEEDEFDEEQLEALSEEQRMEEGRRMFQIFAARMFEQRVLNAYRQKVAAERQRKLIEEMDEESQITAQQQAKKAKEAQKKKDKRHKQKHAKDEEKARKAAEVAAAQAIEERKAEEQRAKKEEQRKKKEAEKKLADEERKRKEDEKQRRSQERKEQQAEVERRQRAIKEQEKHKREQAKLREQEEREAKIQERKDREALASREPDAETQAEALVRGKPKQGDLLTAQPATTSKRPSPAPVATLSSQNTLQTSHAPSTHASPRLPIATPVLPKPPTPGRLRRRSIHDSRTSSPKPSQPASSSAASPTTSSEAHKATLTGHSWKPSQPNSRQVSGQQPRFSPVNAPPGLGGQLPGFAGPAPQLPNGYPVPFMSSASPSGQGTAALHIHGYQDRVPDATAQYRNASIPYPPGFHPARQGGTSLHGAMELQNPEVHPTKSSSSPFGPPLENGRPHPHSRNPSASSNISPREFNQRPAPIQRPSSVAPQHQELDEEAKPSDQDIDDLSGHLGSSALLDDTDDAPKSAIEDLRRGSVAVGGARQGGFGPAPSFAPIGTSIGPQNMNKTWHQPQGHFATSGSMPQPFSPSFGRQMNGTVAFGVGPQSARPGGHRLIRVRQLICVSCEKLSHFNPINQGWHLAEHIVAEVQAMMGRNEPPVPLLEVLHACDLDGNSQNGGGHFDYRGQESTGFVIKYVSGHSGPPNDRKGSFAGEVGSLGGSVTGNPISAGTGQPTFQPPPGLPLGGTSF